MMSIIMVSMDVTRGITFEKLANGRVHVMADGIWTGDYNPAEYEIKPYNGKLRFYRAGSGNASEVPVGGPFEIADVDWAGCTPSLSAPASVEDAAKLISESFFDIALGGGGAGGSTTPIVDNLLSSSATSALSANQGRVLSAALDSTWVIDDTLYSRSIDGGVGYELLPAQDTQSLYQGTIAGGAYDFTVFPTPTTGNSFIDGGPTDIPAGTHFIADGVGSFQLFAPDFSFITYEFTEGDLITVVNEAANWATAILNINEDKSGTVTNIAAYTFQTTNEAIVNVGEYYQSNPDGTTWGAEKDCYNLDALIEGPSLNNGATQSSPEFPPFEVQEDGTFTFTHAGTVVNGNGGFSIYDSPQNTSTNLASGNIFSSVGDRIDGANPSKTYSVALLKGVTYYAYSWSGGGGRVENISLVAPDLCNVTSVSINIANSNLTMEQTDTLALDGNRLVVTNASGNHPTTFFDEGFNKSNGWIDETVGGLQPVGGVVSIDMEDGVNWHIGFANGRGPMTINAVFSKSITDRWWFATTSLPTTSDTLIFASTANVYYPIQADGTQEKVDTIFLPNGERVVFAFENVSSSKSVMVYSTMSIPELGSESGFPVDTTGYAALANPDIAFNASGDTIIAVEGSAVTAVLLNTESGADTITLAASAGLGATSFYVNDSVSTNAAVLKVQSGETLNGAVDGSFNFSNYANGTEFIATEVSGGWVVSVAGASQQTGLHRAAGWSTDNGFQNRFNIFNDSPWEFYDPNGLIDVANSEIIIEKAGLYKVKAKNGGSSAGIATLVISVNGVGVAEGYGWGTTGSAGQASAQWIGDLNVGDVVTLFVDRSQRGAWFSVDELPSAESVLAGMVTPENLHYASVNSATSTNIGNATTAIGSTYRVPDLDHVDAVTNDPFGLVNTTDNSFTIVQDGTYELTGYSASSSGSNDELAIYIDGTKIVAGFVADNVAGIQTPSPITTIRSLTAGQKVEFGWNTATSTPNFVGPSFTVRQIATSTVVMPEALEVADLHRVSLRKDNGGTFSGATNVDFNVVNYDVGGLQDVATGGAKIVQDGTYQVTASVLPGANTTNSQIALEVNGVAIKRSIYVPDQSPNAIDGLTTTTVTATLELAAGDEITINGFASPSTTFPTFLQDQPTLEVIQLASQEVIDQTNTPVNDQTASGYMDIGTMRIQSGFDPGTTTGIRTVVFPAPFDVAPFVQVTAVQAASGNARIATIRSVSTTQFTFQVQNHSASATADDAYWQATGLKP